jgi:hypothetical protein
MTMRVDPLQPMQPRLLVSLAPWLRGAIAESTKASKHGVTELSESRQQWTTNAYLDVPYHRLSHTSYCRPKSSKADIGPAKPGYLSPRRASILPV